MSRRLKAGGFYEWGTRTVSIQNGCEHDCRYCWARMTAQRFKRPCGSDWAHPQIRQKDVERGRRKLEGTIAAFSTHDITPRNLDACLTVLEKLLVAGNQVLIVTKGRYKCVDAICARFDRLVFGPQIEFRFSIGSLNDSALQYWEPGAPRFNERLFALQYAWGCDWATSVSCEPLLDTAGPGAVIGHLSPYCSDSIWIGRMNYVSRIPVETEKDREMVDALKASQTPERVRGWYERHKDNPKVKWKDSVKKIVGIPVATVAGMDR